MKTNPDGKVEFDSLADLPPVAVSCSTMGWNRTGMWRLREPVFQDRRAPCNVACPAGEDVADQMRFLAAGDPLAAGRLLLRANPFPAVTGRVCPHPCTASCNRALLDGALDVPGVEREIGDYLLATGFAPAPAPPNGRKVSIVGSGPAGLTAAFHLALAGFEVTVHDRTAEPGGLLATGIPPWRLPREVLAAEIARVFALGVRFDGRRVLGTDFTLEELRGDADAVILAIGLHDSRRLSIPGEDGPGVVAGLEMLRELHRGEAARPGNPVLVIGGGNTAFDCARSLRRAGREVTIAYRRGRSAMPAFPDEIAEAVEEGVRIEEWLAPVEVERAGEELAGVRFVRTRPGEPDASGRPRPEPVPDSEELRPAGLVVVAAGERLDQVSVPESLAAGAGVAVDGAGRTNLRGVFACGDMTGDAGTVAIAIGRGRRVAAAICADFDVPGPSRDPARERGAGEKIAGPEHIRAGSFASMPALPRVRIAVEDRDDRAEVLPGFGPDRAGREASRCLSCGTCTGCDTCYVYCPDQAIARSAPGRYELLVERCKGCGVCVTECPRGAIELVELSESHGNQ